MENVEHNYRSEPRYDRSEADFYIEPRWAADALFDAERFVGKIVDPACGSGNIVRAAESYGLEATGIDVVQRWDRSEIGNFLNEWSPHYPTDNIISNPPYGLAEAWVERALGAAHFKVALLLRLAFLESEKRRTLFESTPLARVHVFSSRVSMPPGGAAIAASGGKTAYAWFVWSKDHQGPPTLNWLKKP